MLQSKHYIPFIIFTHRQTITNVLVRGLIFGFTLCMVNNVKQMVFLGREGIPTSHVNCIPDKKSLLSIAQIWYGSHHSYCIAVHVFAHYSIL